MRKIIAILLIAMTILPSITVDAKSISGQPKQAALFMQRKEY